MVSRAVGKGIALCTLFMCLGYLSYLHTHRLSHNVAKAPTLRLLSKDVNEDDDQGDDDFEVDRRASGPKKYFAKGRNISDFSVDGVLDQEERESPEDEERVPLPRLIEAVKEKGSSAEEKDKGSKSVTSRFHGETGKHSCPANRRIVYVKTHKTGSSTLANIFHRYVLNYNLTAVLPKGNLFLGWPASAGIPNSYVRIPGIGEAPYDVFCSAHTRYSRPLIEKIVPDASYISVVREPVNHFISSWSYWGVKNHIREVSNQDVSIEQFLENVDWSLGRKGDRDLLHNSVMFDFGYTHEDMEDPSKVREHLEHLKTFSMVLVTEYMDESLVLMKRRLCLKLEDVVYHALKVKGPKKVKPTLPDHLKKKIYEINNADLIVYKYFNESLWQSIALEPNFQQEVDEFRRLKDEVSDNCADYTSFSEDLHRAALLNPSTSEGERQCHKMQLDSPGFVKYLKAKANVPDRECVGAANKLRKEVVYIKTHKTGSSTLTNLFHRFALKYRLRTVLPRNNYFLGWPNSETLPSSYVRLPAKKKSPDYEMFCSAHTRYSRPYLSKLLPKAHYITVLRDPVNHFISSWNYWHISSHVKTDTGTDLTMEEFLENPTLHMPKVGGREKLIHNSMSYDLGIPCNPTKEEVNELLRDLHTFATVLITEHMAESLVYMRRFLCWEMDDIAYMSLKVSGKPKEINDKVANAIRELNWADNMIYNEMKNILFEKISREVGFDEEMTKFKQLVVERSEQCKDFAGKGDDVHRKALLEQDITTDERRCHTYTMDSPGFVKYLKRLNDVNELECSTQGNERSNVVFIQTHTRLSQTISDIFTVHQMKSNSIPILPKRLLDKDLGWTSQTGLEGSYLDCSKTGRYSGLSVAPTVLNKQIIDDLIPGAEYIAIVQQPLARLLYIWKHIILPQLQFANEKSQITLGSFAKDPTSVYEILGDSARVLLENGMMFALGEPSKGNSWKPAVNRAVNKVRRYIIEEMLDESLVATRRYLCWSLEDMAYVLPESVDSGYKPNAATIALLNRKFLQGDNMLYETLKRNLISSIKNKEIKFDEELKAFKSMRKATVANAKKGKCTGMKRAQCDYLNSGSAGVAQALSKKYQRLYDKSSGVNKHNKVVGNQDDDDEHDDDDNGDDNEDEDEGEDDEDEDEDDEE